MSYGIKEIFYTLQGEGVHAGTPAAFVRFAGCNLWSGRDVDRQRDAARHGARCPVFCDTDFVAGEALSAAEIVARAYALAGDSLPLVVFTGGEPFLQLDAALVGAFRMAFARAVLAVETNGAVEPRVTIGTIGGVDWVCVSPKTADSRVLVRRANELKVVVPAYTPHDYADLAAGFDHLFVSPEAVPTAVGVSVLASEHMRAAVAWVLANPRWRLSLQTHKVLGIP